jgi:hypothetical protein
LFNILNGPNFLKSNFVLGCFVLMCFQSRYTLSPSLKAGSTLRFLFAYAADCLFKNWMSIASCLWNDLSCSTTIRACSACDSSGLGGLYASG